MQHSPQKQLPASVKAAAVIITAAIGGFLSRWHGGGFISGSPKLLKAFLWSLPFALATGAAFHIDDHSWLVTSGVATLVLLGCIVFKNTGHGGGMDMATSPKEPGNGRKPEKLEYLILWLHGKMPRYWYDALLLTVIGTFSTLVPAIAFAFVNPWAAVVLQLGGTIGKPVGYMAGHAMAKAGLLKDLPHDLDHATAVGELLTGVMAYGFLATATLMVIFQ